MQVFTLNVGQGAMAIVRHQGEVVIIDARIPPSTTPGVTFVKGQLSRFLSGHALRGLILTGFDKDHSDAPGVAIVLRKYRPEWIAYPDYDKDTAEYRAVQEIIDEQVEARRHTSSPLVRRPITVQTLRSRPITRWMDAFDFEVFSPHPDDMDSSNNCSLVMKVTGTGPDGFSYLATGDTELGRWEVINRIFGSKLKADVMAAAHHGAQNGTHARTLLHVAPETILISAGASNPYGHPAPQVVRAFKAVTPHVYGTHDGGSLCTRRVPGGFETIRYHD